MKKALLVTALFWTVAAMAAPDAFTLRSSMKYAKDRAQAGGKTIESTVLKFYGGRRDREPLWVSKAFTVSTDANGVYECTLRDSDRDGEGKALSELFRNGEINYFGVYVHKASIGPRQRLVTVPYAAEARLAQSVAAQSEIGELTLESGTSEVGSVVVRERLVCGDFTAADGLDFGVMTYRIDDGAGARLVDNPDNRILGDQREASVTLGEGTVVFAPASAEPKTAAVIESDRGGLITIVSDDGVSVPGLTVPVGGDEKFVWPAGGYTGAVKVRFTAWGN